MVIYKEMMETQKILTPCTPHEVEIHPSCVVMGTYEFYAQFNFSYEESLF